MNWLLTRYRGIERVPIIAGVAFLRRREMEVVARREDRGRHEGRALIAVYMSLQPVTSKPNTGRAPPQHKAYPYLLPHWPLGRPERVYSTVLTCLRVGRSFAYRVAVVSSPAPILGRLTPV